MKGSINKLMVVAHPDDETLFGGQELLKEEGWFVLCLTNGDNPLRRKQFFEALAMVNAKGEIWNYPDTPGLSKQAALAKQGWQPYSAEMQTRVKQLYESYSFEKVVTHNSVGEYGHEHHKLTHQLIRKVIPPKIIYCFGQGKTIDAHRLQKKLVLLAIYDDQFSENEKVKYANWINKSTIYLLNNIATHKLIDKLPSVHPRFLYTNQKVQEIRKTLSSTRKKNWQALRQKAVLALEIAPPVYPDFQFIENKLERKIAYKAYYKAFRKTVDEDLQYLSLAYLFSKEARFLKAAKSIVLEIASWPTSKEDVSSVFPNYYWDEIGLSMARCLHRAFDWLYDGLSEEERAILFKACKARAEQTHARLIAANYLEQPANSHCSRLIVYLGEVALVLGKECPEAKEWLDYSMQAVTTVYPHWATEDGGWAEGLWYAHDYILFGLPFLLALHSDCQVNIWQRPFYQNVPTFIFYTAALKGEIEPFGDGAEMNGFKNSGEHFAQLMTFFGQLFEDEKIKWWAIQAGGLKSKAWELGLFFEDLVQNTSLKADFIEDLPKSKIFPAIGWAALHSDWSRPEEDTFLLFKSSPFGSISHSHADQNAFTIMKGGQALAIPSGYYGPAYGFPHHLNWTQSTKANNCILVNQQGQATQNAQATGAIIDFQEKQSIVYVAGDATAAYEGKLLKWKRHILFLRPSIILLLDELEAPKPTHFQWLLHSFEKMVINKTNITVKRKTARLDLRLYCKEGLDVLQTNQFDTPYNEGLEPKDFVSMPNQWHLTASTRNASSKIRIAGVMVVADTMQPIPIQITQKNNVVQIKSLSSFGTVEGSLYLSADSNKLLYGKTNLEEMIIDKQ